MATVAGIRVTGPSQMAGIGDGQSLKSASVKYEWATAVASGTVITGPLIQAGSVVVDVLVVINGGGTATVDVGDPADPNRFIAAGTGPVARTNVATGRPTLLTANTTVDVTTGTAATGAAGSIDLTVFFQPRNT